MGTQYKSLKEDDITFIKNQKLFYIASCSGGEVNLSPKGYDTIRVIDADTIVFTNFPGSGNRTYRDASRNGEFTLVFNAFEGEAQILCLFCKAGVITKDHAKYTDYLKLFDIKESVIRDIFAFRIYAVESSCGMSVPYYEYKGERNELKNWAYDMDAKDKLEAYKRKRFTPPNLQEIE